MTPEQHRTNVGESPYVSVSESVENTGPENEIGESGSCNRIGGHAVVDVCHDFRQRAARGPQSEAHTGEKERSDQGVVELLQ